MRFSLNKCFTGCFTGSVGVALRTSSHLNLIVAFELVSL
jgi:energy-converting hydrogenase Eha subunit C